MIKKLDLADIFRSKNDDFINKYRTFIELFYLEMKVHSHFDFPA